jgi:hypothetical protein
MTTRDKIFGVPCCLLAALMVPAVAFGVSWLTLASAGIAQPPTLAHWIAFDGTGCAMIILGWLWNPQ